MMCQATSELNGPAGSTIWQSLQFLLINEGVAKNEYNDQNVNGVGGVANDDTNNSSAETSHTRTHGRVAENGCQ